MQLYQNKSSYPKPNAQENLMGRTHYVDDATLRFHHSTILSTHVLYEGLLFAIITRDAADYENKTRKYRYVIFDLFGTVIDRPKLEDMFSTRNQASKAMWAMINTLDAKALTLAGIENAEKWHKIEMDELRARLKASEEKAA
jgi:hypothetical protein